MPSFDADSLKKQMESDLDVKLDVPETVTVGKASKDVFDKIKKEMKDEIISQDEAIDNLVNAFIWLAENDWMYAVDEEFNSLPEMMK